MFNRFLFLVAAGLMLAVSSTQGVETSAAPDGSPNASTTPKAKAAAIYIIYDSSNSMWGPLQGEQRKYEAARKALVNFVDNEIEGREVAFRAYGHRRAKDCTDSELIVPFTSDNVGEEIKTAINAIRPTGQTPIDFSLRRALEDFGDRSGEILLLTDGIESCDADPCALLAAWKEKNVKVNVHVVGIGLSEKEKVAIQCLADAAGTEFLDAQSEQELTESLVTAAGEPERDNTPGDFHLTVNYAGGRKIDRQLTAIGTLSPLDERGKLMEVSSNGRFTPLPGKYTLTAGVRVVTGAMYKPLTQELEILSGKSHRITISPPIPPAVKTEFWEVGEKVRPGFVYAYQEGDAVFKFRGKDITYIPEGSFEFRSDYNVHNKNLVVTESFSAGDFKTVKFQLKESVLIYAQVNAQDSGYLFSKHPLLEQNGKPSGTVRNNNGGLVIPGTHELVMRDGLNEYRTTIEVTHEEKQRFKLIAPAGNYRLHYQNKDGSAEKAKRIFVYGPMGSKSFTSEKAFALLPGEYRIVGWPKANYAEQKLSVNAGDDADIVFRAMDN